MLALFGWLFELAFVEPVSLSCLISISARLPQSQYADLCDSAMASAGTSPAEERTRGTAQMRTGAVNVDN